MDNRMIKVMKAQVEKLLHNWHEAGRQNWNNWSNRPENYDKDYNKSYYEREKYVCLDCGYTGQFLLDKDTGAIYLIMSYGVPNFKKQVGCIDGIPGSELHQYDFYYKSSN
jgi:hypothetical protein